MQTTGENSKDFKVQKSILDGKRNPGKLQAREPAAADLPIREARHPLTGRPGLCFNTLSILQK